MQKQHMSTSLQRKLKRHKIVPHPSIVFPNNYPYETFCFDVPKVFESKVAIYRIEFDGLFYIGSSTDIESRVLCWMMDFEGFKRFKPQLSKMLTNGSNKIRIWIMEYPENSSEEYLRQREYCYINELFDENCLNTHKKSSRQYTQNSPVEPRSMPSGTFL